MDLSFLLMFVNSSKVGGWVRGGVASGLVMLVANYPFLSDYLSPSTQTELAAAASAIAVGIWSHVAKSIGAGATGTAAANAVRTGQMPARS